MYGSIFTYCIIIVVIAKNTYFENVAESDRYGRGGRERERACARVCMCDWVEMRQQTENDCIRMHCVSVQCASTGNVPKQRHTHTLHSLTWCRGVAIGICFNTLSPCRFVCRTKSVYCIAHGEQGLNSGHFRLISRARTLTHIFGQHRFVRISGSDKGQRLWWHSICRRWLSMHACTLHPW